MLAAISLAGCAQPAGDDTPVRTQRIEIPGPWVFEPAVAEVEAGLPVVFANGGGADHTVTIESLDFDAVVAPGGETSYTFDQPGTYEYVCKYHPPDMKGTIIVLAPTTEAA